MFSNIKDQNFVRSLYAKVPFALRNGYWAYKEIRRLIKRTQFLSKDELLIFQFEKLKTIVNYAWENIPGYRILWEENNFNPSILRSLDDLNLIPMISKDHLRKNINQFINKKILFKYHTTTGGSTGSPLGFYQEQKNKFIEKAFIIDLWSRKYPEIELNTNATVLRGKNIEGIFTYDPMDGLILSTYDISSENIIKFINAIEYYQTPILKAYPSAIYLMAKLIKDNGLKINHKFKALMLGSEPIYPFQKILIDKIFKTKISHWYGQTEKVVLAGNCEYNNAFHIYPQYGITEINKYKNTGFGEIIGTGFWNFATPFIRYKTQDFAEMGPEKCDHCGRNYQLLNKIEGRMQDFVIDKEGKLITLTALVFAQHFESFDKIKQMQIVQDDIGKITININPIAKLLDNDKKEIIKKMRYATKNNLDIDIVIKKDFNLTSNGKFKFLEQNLDIHNFI